MKRGDRLPVPNFKHGWAGIQDVGKIHIYDGDYSHVCMHDVCDAKGAFIRLEERRKQPVSDWLDMKLLDIMATAPIYKTLCTCHSNSL